MFDVGFSEMLVIAFVALLVLGPERLPRAARVAGLWVRKLRAQWYTVQADLERELADEELRRSVGQPLEELQRTLNDEAQLMRRQVASQVASLESPPTAPIAPTEPDA